jgi:outer membrane protein OmpU
MNNFKKIGLTALAGSLVAVSATAGEMSVSGSLGATYSTQAGNTNGLSDDAGAITDPNHQEGLGTDKDFAVSGSGELDNGWTFSGSTVLKDTMTLSSSSLSMTMGSLGTLMMGSIHGGNSTKYDVQTPTAYEEVDDGGAESLSANYVGNFLDNNAIQYTSPSFDISSGMTMTVDVEYAPSANDTATADGGASANSTYGDGTSLGLTFAGNGAKIGVYGAERTSDDNNPATLDQFNGVWFANYAYGPVSVGYSQSYHDAGLRVNAEGVDAVKVVNVSGGIFEAETMSIAFNVNDNLSVSYAKAEDVYDAQASGTAESTIIKDVTMDMKSIQVAYSMGSMSIKAYRTETTNVDFQTNGGTLTVNEIAVGLAF